jgi:GTP-binding protein
MFQKIVATCPRPASTRRPVQDARDPARPRQFPGPHPHRPDRERPLDVNTPINAIDVDGNPVEDGRATKVFAFRGLDRVPVESAQAGDIVAIAGPHQGDRVQHHRRARRHQPSPSRPIDPPTLAMSFAVNDSPYAGRDGDKVQSRVIRDRLEREAETNVAIRLTESQERDAFEVAGRGELQLGVLIETMRREGFELSISRPRVLFQDGPTAARSPMRPSSSTSTTSIRAPSSRRWRCARAR